MITGSVILLIVIVAIAFAIKKNNRKETMHIDEHSFVENAGMVSIPCNHGGTTP